MISSLKFSIIVPVYNVAPYLRECLDSILAQTNRDWEAICVDDGSTDRSGEILDEYAQRNRRFVIKHQPNGGVSSARNAALSMAHGEWVIFVDADDVMPPFALDAYRKYIDRYQAVDIVRANTIRFKDGEIPSFGATTGSEACTVSDFTTHLDYPDLASMMWGAAYRRSKLPRAGFKPYCRGEDRLFVGEFLANAQAGVRIADKLYAYRDRPGSAMTSRMDVKKLSDRLGYSLDWLNMLVSCGKQIDKRIFHEIGINVTEGFVDDLYRLPALDRSSMWLPWRVFLRKVRKLHCFLPWTQFVVMANVILPFDCVANILCRLPMALKKKGFHR